LENFFIIRFVIEELDQGVGYQGTKFNNGFIQEQLALAFDFGIAQLASLPDDLLSLVLALAAAQHLSKQKPGSAISGSMSDETLQHFLRSDQIVGGDGLLGLLEKILGPGIKPTDVPNARRY
jgi:hypothetical protein